ncbi:unnamed protein product [Ectocarpus sp. CCAP 1310/34]|nr:unnamed protein product [Ectocarpus sp. CCAP 1310/34]
MAKITTTTRTGVEYSGDVGACDFEATAEGDGVTGLAAGAPVRTVTPPAAVTAASAAAGGKAEVELALEGNLAAERKRTEKTDTMNTIGNTRASKVIARLATQKPVTPPGAVAMAAAAAAKLQLKARGSPTSSRRSTSASLFSTYRSLLAMPALDALNRRVESNASPGGDAGVFPAASTAASNAGGGVSSFGRSRKNANSGISEEGWANNSGGFGGGGGEGNGDSSGHQRGGESGGAGGILRTSDSATQWKSFDSATSEVSLRKGNTSDEPGRRPTAEVASMESPQSMLLTSEENNIMRLPNYSSFMRQQESLQALLVDIHQDPDGFTDFVEARRSEINPVGEASVSNVTSALESLSDYTNLTQIGSGRFSVVFYAESKRTGRPCAIKRIPLADPQLDEGGGGGTSPSPRDAQAEKSTAVAAANTTASTIATKAPATPGVVTAEEFGGLGEGVAGDGERRGNLRKYMTYETCVKEVGLLKNLASPNIVKLHTCFLGHNALWVVMDWMDGGDLKGTEVSVVLFEGVAGMGMSWRQVIAVELRQYTDPTSCSTPKTTTAASGVLRRTKQSGRRLDEITVWGYFTQICDALLHMHGERIIHRDIKPANVFVSRDGIVKLGDLGLGRYLSARSVLAMSQVGTPLYMSPETLKGQGYDMGSDIWSLGCVLYELAQLESPFAGKHLTMKTLFRKIVQAEYPPLDCKTYSPCLTNLVAHLLMPDPTIRPRIELVHQAAQLAFEATLKGIEIRSGSVFD